MKGFTFVEVLVTLGIIAIVMGVSITSFVSYSKKQSLEAGTAALVAALRDARAQTLASVGGTQYGVNIEQRQFTFFQGSSYSTSSPSNEPFVFGSHVVASSTRPYFVFQRITGNAVASGTIDVYLDSDPSTKRSVKVEATGIIDIE